MAHEIEVCSRNNIPSEIEEMDAFCRTLELTGMTRLVGGLFYDSKIGCCFINPPEGGSFKPDQAQLLTILAAHRFRHFGIAGEEHIGGQDD